MLNNWPGSPRQHAPHDCLPGTSNDSMVSGLGSGFLLATAEAAKMASDVHGQGGREW